MKVLHITNWYPDTHNPQKALWIKRLIFALPEGCQNTICHVEIKKGRLNWESGENKDGSRFYILHLPLHIWRLNEIISYLIIRNILTRNRAVRFDVVNFHIAYPNCTYIHHLKKYLHCPVVISEHWSGYHYNFNISLPRKRRRIQRIFRHDIPVIAVSKALVRDIQTFSQTGITGYVVPNTVEPELFNYESESYRSGAQRFFMASQWRWPKDPFTVILSWQKVLRKYPGAVLRIAGYGEQWKAMQEMIHNLNLHGSVTMLGTLTSEQVAIEMKKSVAFIHCSEYETFSVVCAEALCCGTPVIASKVGGITEYVHEENGLLVSENTPEAFADSIIRHLSKGNHYDPARISKEALDRFSPSRIGRLYYSALEKIIAG